MLFYWIWPLLLALLPVAFKVKRLRIALLWIVIAYAVSAFGLAIIPHFLILIDTGAGDPKITAGSISKSLVTSILLAVIDIPLALLVFWGFKKLRGNG